ncbi:14013_t:CDS:2 [Acaulospora morrowiae]|uniref:14013_t:CDS:1 n=1 Tax=Acaulospora morrowiae TaxID=94023 RepID=A0A9N9F1M1_9GLOM|nr:14013_t:CDS:2 [Acaulospora morrowiae]
MEMTQNFNVSYQNSDATSSEEFSSKIHDEEYLSPCFLKNLAHLSIKSLNIPEPDNAQADKLNTSRIYIEENSREGLEDCKIKKFPWEEFVERVENIVQESGTKLYGEVVWKSGKKTKEAIEDLEIKCPKQLNKFYRKHLQVIMRDGYARRL